MTKLRTQPWSPIFFDTPSTCTTGEFVYLNLSLWGLVCPISVGMRVGYSFISFSNILATKDIE